MRTQQGAAAMNAGAYQMALRLRAYQCGLPGAVSLGLEGEDEGQGKWALVRVVRALDDANDIKALSSPGHVLGGAS